MYGTKIAMAVALAACSVAGTAGVASAAPPGAGCPAYGNPGGNSGFVFLGLLLVSDAVDRSVAQIPTDDMSVAVTGLTLTELRALRTDIFTGADKNGDRKLCVGLSWGAELNGHSHWANVFATELFGPTEVELFHFSDNRTGRA